MTRTLFIRRFDRGLPRGIAYTLLAVATLAAMDYYKGSLMANTPSAPSLVLHWPTPDTLDDGTGIPRECDLPAGIATDCLFLD